MVSMNRNSLRSSGTKNLPAKVTKGAKRVGNFALHQLKYPAVGNFIREQAGILAATGFNPKIAAPAMAARAAEEGVAIAGRTARHFGGF